METFYDGKLFWALDILFDTGFTVLEIRVILIVLMCFIFQSSCLINHFYSPEVLSEEEVSVYDIKDHPDFKYRPGSCVIRVVNSEVC